MLSGMKGEGLLKEEDNKGGTDPKSLKKKIGETKTNTAVMGEEVTKPKGEKERRVDWKENNVHL